MVRPATFDSLPHRLLELQAEIDNHRQLQRAAQAAKDAEIDRITADVAGDPDYSNERRRKAEISLRLANCAEYKEAERDEYEHGLAIVKAEREHRYYRDTFRVKQAEYERETALKFAERLDIALQRLAHKL